MYKVSVIMPIFNGEEYLENSLNSVINQTIGFENIELIIIDDCSTDGTKNILDEYSKKYSNIKTIFLDKNSGCPGIPRNIGIKNATSDYIMFIDDDDEYFPEICNKLYNTLISEDADIVVCNLLTTDNQFSNKYQIDSRECILNNEIVYLNNVYVWNCIFKKSIISENNISFIDGAQEDSIFTLKYYIHSKKAICLNDFIGCNYFIRKDSISHFSFEYEIDVINSYYTIVKILEENNCDLNRYFKRKIRRSIIKAIFLGNKDEIKEIFSRLYEFEKKIHFKGKLPIIYQLINFFILHGNVHIATYICLFISAFRKSNLVLKIYRKFFLKHMKNFRL